MSNGANMHITEREHMSSAYSYKQPYLYNFHVGEVY